jgi:predicted transcriptional regulator
MRVKSRPVTKKKRPQVFRNFGWMVVGSGIVLAAGTAFGLWKTGDQFFNRLSDIVSNRQPEPKVDVRSVIVQQVREASELTTAVYTMEAVVPAQQDSTLGSLVVGTTKLLYVARGEVRAGVDLSQITAANVEVMGEDAIRLTLPAPKILDQKIDVSKSSVYDYNRGFLGLGPDVAPNLQKMAQDEALKKIKIAACGDGVLEKASDRAKMVVSQLIKVAGFKTVLVETQPVPVSTCQSL